jgi:integrase
LLPLHTVLAALGSTRRFLLRSLHGPHRLLTRPTAGGHTRTRGVIVRTRPREAEHRGQQLHHTWTRAQLRAFLDHVRDDRFFALWLLVVTSGFRRGELAGLLPRDIDFQYGRVSPSAPRVVVAGQAQESQTKTRSGERVLALDPDTRDALQDYVRTWDQERELLGQETQLLFVWPNGRPLHPDTISALFHKHCDAAGLPRIRLHDVRHSYVTAALMAGVSPKIVSERLGHASSAFTLQTYSHVIPGMDEAAASSVAALILNAGDDVGTLVEDVNDANGRTSGRQGSRSGWEKAADLGAKAQLSGGSGGRM